MSHELSKAIKAARPRLRVVSPLAHWVMLVMAIFNLVLGLSLYTQFDSPRFSASLLIVNDIFSFKFWGITFMAIGLIKLFALYTNNWNLARRSLLIGVGVKATWAVALTLRTLTSPGTLFVNIIWLTLAMLQMGTYIWFMPPAIASNNQRKV